MRILIVTPTYNERDNLGALVAGIMALGRPSRHPDPSIKDGRDPDSISGEFSVLVVDDASPDGTGELADALSRSHPGRVFALRRPRKLGIGSAYLDGFRFGAEKGFDAICEMDADGSHDPSVLPALAEEIARGADLVLGSRRVPGGKVVGWGPHRHFMSSAAMFLSRTALGLRTKDVTSGFRCYRRSVIEELLRLPIASNGYAFQEETLYHAERLGFKVKEIPIVFRDRVKGSSKLRWPQIFEFFAVIGRLRKAGSLKRDRR